MQLTGYQLQSQSQEETLVTGRHFNRISSKLAHYRVDSDINIFHQHFYGGFLAEQIPPKDIHCVADLLPTTESYQCLQYAGTPLQMKAADLYRPFWPFCIINLLQLGRHLVCISDNITLYGTINKLMLKEEGCNSFQYIIGLILLYTQMIWKLMVLTTQTCY